MALLCSALVGKGQTMSHSEKIDQLIAERDALVREAHDNKQRARAFEKDAERYRKLVATGKYTAASIGGGWGLACGGGRWTKAELDAAADALPDVGAA